MDLLTLGLAVHFLFVSVVAAVYQLPVEGNFKAGHGNTITSAIVESYSTCGGYVTSGYRLADGYLVNQMWLIC